MFKSGVFRLAGPFGSFNGTTEDSAVFRRDCGFVVGEFRGLGVVPSERGVLGRLRVLRAVDVVCRPASPISTSGSTGDEAAMELADVFV